MPERDLIVLGASAGGIEALRELLSRLRRDLSAAVMVVLHLSARSRSYLAEVLGRSSVLPVRPAVDQEELAPGTVYVARPDRHLLVLDGRLLLGKGPFENRHRPAIDPLFRSAARERGARVAAVLLSGMLDDGSAGLAAVKACGGLTLVQAPEEALFPDMPLNALRNVEVDHCLPVAGLASMLSELAGQRVEGPPVPCTQVEAVQLETEMGMSVDQVRRTLQKIGTPASLRCPDCQGPLWEMNDPSVLRYRCEVGHAFTAQSLEDGQAELVERALWSAISALEEKAVVSRRIAERSRQGRLEEIAQVYEARARKAVREAESIRRALGSALDRAGASGPVPRKRKRAPGERRVTARKRGAS